ncbi:hypothetical protein [Legionella fallonii]|uniref:Uncharacterized protein n=1 Tax=Legionella fallonii LLAP-10 TaxID=1212491 RepID=A0A098G248_9GAMM|nr:hypothetical protein [Legionella fallonii]CEG55570.1 protein of unknown function [Legionella fallonii LLAP-10]
MGCKKNATQPTELIGIAIRLAYQIRLAMNDAPLLVVSSDLMLNVVNRWVAKKRNPTYGADWDSNPVNLSDKIGHE